MKNCSRVPVKQKRSHLLGFDIFVSDDSNSKDVKKLLYLCLFFSSSFFFAMSTPKSNYVIMCFPLLQNALIDLFSSLENSVCMATCRRRLPDSSMVGHGEPFGICISSPSGFWFLLIHVSGWCVGLTTRGKCRLVILKSRSATLSSCCDDEALTGVIVRAAESIYRYLNLCCFCVRCLLCIYEHSGFNATLGAHSLC